MKFQEYLVQVNESNLIVPDGDVSITIEGTPIRTSQFNLPRFCERLSEWEKIERFEFKHTENRYHVKHDAKHHSDQHLRFQTYDSLRTTINDRKLMGEVSQSLEEYLSQKD